MFSNWQKEKATTALIDDAQALSDKLSVVKPHILDSQAAAAQFWAAYHRVNGLNLDELLHWKPAAVARFTSATETRIAALRKQRDYASSDGLTIWLHTARAVTEPRIRPAVRDIWRQLSEAGPNADAMTEDLLQEAGLPKGQSRCIPKGLCVED